MAMLGPTDATVVNSFNPRDATGQQIGISVEDVTAYVDFIRDDAGIRHEDELVQALNKLTENVHPLALGNVKRSISQSRLLARKLLALHMDANNEEHKINEIVDNLTSKSFYHGHPINRQEAIEQVGITTVSNPSSDLEELMWQLYLDYEQEMNMGEPFQPAAEFLKWKPDLKPNESALSRASTAKIAFIESVHRTDVVSLEYQLFGQKDANQITHVNLTINRQGWDIE